MIYYKIVNCTKEYISILKVINDAAERGVKMLSEYLLILTKDEDLRGKIIQVVEHNRRQLKKGTKASFFDKFGD